MRLRRSAAAGKRERGYGGDDADVVHHTGYADCLGGNTACAQARRRVAVSRARTGARSRCRALAEAVDDGLEAPGRWMPSRSRAGSTYARRGLPYRCARDWLRTRSPVDDVLLRRYGREA